MYSNVLFVILAVIYKNEVNGYPINGYETGSSSSEDKVHALQISVTDGVENSFSYFITTHCKPEILDKSSQSFSLDNIANNGDFKFVYVTGFATIMNATTEFHGDSEVGYRRSVTLLDNKGKTTVQYYKLKEMSPGVIWEIYQNTNSMGKSFTNSYKLIILNYDPDLAVLEFIRCSDKGRKPSEDKYILVNACTSDPDSSFQKAAELYQQDVSAGFGTGIQSLHPI